MMDTLQDLVTACQANENLLRQQAQARTESWQPWLAPVSATRPREEVPGYDDDSQLIREEVNKLSGIRRGLISGRCSNVCTCNRVGWKYRSRRLHLFAWR
ncbi:hypothetical protein [Klebsiella michiganensis]|uniref:hypothetical protein n=1 Tax=Klebsiella michiganensis TaxID=1134687 RepID=UPI001CCB357F|nr:hypothetical protein [Klebsiella michiganensis]MCW9622343.1 hypothetical protein [Klebsiella michiganensis]